MTKKVAVLQSNYIPWKGYFDIIGSVDEFIFYDEVQYTKNDWRNRNRIKDAKGLLWLTIPVRQTTLKQKVNETIVADTRWKGKHLKSIKHCYSKAKFFSEHVIWFEEIFETCTYHELSLINYHFITAILKFLGITAKLTWSCSNGLPQGKTERLLDLIKKAGATEYLSGPSAKCYLKEDLFEQENIKVTWMDYSNYLEYPQMYPPFENFVSIVDLILNVGSNAKSYMKFSK